LYRPWTYGSNVSGLVESKSTDTSIAKSASAAARNALEDAAELGLPVVKPLSEGRVFVR
jgi:hypothetical protein